MKTIAQLVVVSCLVAVGAGCSNLHAHHQRTGKIYPALSKDCELRFENLSLEEARARFEPVGLVTLSGSSDEPEAWEGETRRRLAPEACKLGGNVVTFNAATSNAVVMGYGGGIIQFMVWRDGESAPAAANHE